VTTSDSVRSAAEGGSGFCAADRRWLAVMPLHAITSLHGEEGLRERLLVEIAQFPAADRTRIGSALELMWLAHARDRRQREPYVNHPLRVTIRILSHYRVTDPHIACAALLHDVVEDHAEYISPDGTRQGALDMLGRQFGERTAQVVAEVTNPVWEPGRDKHEQYREHVAVSLAASPWARVVKVSDFTDNAIGLFHTTGPKVPELARKYRPLIPVLRELVLRTDTPLQPEAKDTVVRQLGKTEVRFASLD
jgi:hypothetical protein